MERKEIADLAIEALAGEFPEAICSLDYENVWQLLISTRLSAQCTDARVNIVTQELYTKYPTIQALAEGDIGDIEEMIKSCGLYKTKARDIKAAAQIICERYGGNVPDTMEELLSLPGVGRKTANLVLGDAFGKPGIVADTHCIRITNRLGLTDTKDPYKVEMQLNEVIETADRGDFCHRCVLHGRKTCTARSPKCDSCTMSSFCPAVGVSRDS